MNDPVVLKTLWMLRFEKMKKNESEAAWQYQELLNACLPVLGENSLAVRYLKQLVTEEREHEKCAEELIRICHAAHPEIGIL